jgi:uncharacterized membrane protein
MKLTPYPAIHYYSAGIPIKAILVVLTAALAIMVITMIIDGVSHSKHTDKIGSFVGMTILGAMIAIIVILFVSIMNSTDDITKTGDEIQSVQQSSISSNIKKAESYYGISDISIDTSKNYIMLTSVGRNDSGLDNKDARFNQKLKDEENKNGTIISDITFSMDGKEYSGVIKNKNGTINIFKNDGEMLTKSIKSR